MKFIDSTVFKLNITLDIQEKTPYQNHKSLKFKKKSTIHVQTQDILEDFSLSIF